MSGQDQLLSWLNDAYGMETGLVPVLENHARDADYHPEIKERYQQHAEESKRHAEQVKGCIEQLGGDVSSLKAALGRLSGMMNSVASGVFHDEVVKNILSDYAAEHFEIACYQALVVTAEECGEAQVADVCRQILKEEEAMASWIESHLPLAVTAHLNENRTAAVH